VARSSTLIGIPAPSVADKASDKPPEKSSDKPPEKSSDKPPEKASDQSSLVAPVPVGKRTLIGIAAPIIDQKTTPSEPAKAAPTAGSAPPPAPAEPRPAPLPETRHEQASGAPHHEPEEQKVSRAKSPLAQTRKETPDALAAAKREARATSKGAPSDAPEKSSRLGSILLLLLIGAGAVWFVMHKQRESEEALNEQLKPAQVEQAPQEKPPEMPVTPPTTETPEPTASAAASAAAPEPEASAAPAASASAAEAPSAAPEAAPPAKTAPRSPTAEAEPVSAEGTRVVIVRLMPPDARLFYKGKSVGKSPVRIELKPGEKKRSFEVGRPGYVTRRLVVDGSEPQVSIGLRPESGVPTE
jgi:hypothetical protein